MMVCMHLIKRIKIVEGNLPNLVEIPRDDAVPSGGAVLLSAKNGYMNFLSCLGDCARPKRSWDIPTDAVQVKFRDYRERNVHNGRKVNIAYGEPTFYPEG